MRENKGVFFALITALISGFSVFLNKFAVSFWDNSSVFATAKNLIVAIFLVSLIILFKKSAELKSNFSAAYYLTAQVYEIQGKTAEALQNYQIVLQLEPGNEEIQKKVEELSK